MWALLTCCCTLLYHAYIRVYIRYKYIWNSCSVFVGTWASLNVIWCTLMQWIASNGEGTLQSRRAQSSPAKLQETRVVYPVRPTSGASVPIQAKGCKKEHLNDIMYLDHPVWESWLDHPALRTGTSMIHPGNASYSHHRIGAEPLSVSRWECLCWQSLNPIAFSHERCANIMMFGVGEPSGMALVQGWCR